MCLSSQHKLKQRFTTPDTTGTPRGAGGSLPRRRTTTSHPKVEPLPSLSPSAGAPSRPTRRSLGRSHQLGLVVVAAALVAVVAACAPLAPSRSPAAPLPSGGACNVAVVGDSLTVLATPYFAPAMADQGCTLAWQDGVSGRRTAEGVDVIAANVHRLPEILVVALGTNDEFHLADFAAHVDAVMAMAAGRQVVWTESAHDPVKRHVNTVLFLKSISYPNLTVMAWDTAYWSNPTWQLEDRVHCTDLGSRARAKLSAAAVAEVFARTTPRPAPTLPAVPPTSTTAPETTTTTVDPGTTIPDVTIPPAPPTTDPG